MNIHRAATCCVLTLLFSGAALAADPAPKPADNGASLDQLLNIPTPPKPAPAKPPAAPQQPEPTTTSTDPFRAAVGEMNQAAGKLTARDAGIDTQRLQEGAIKRLDQLIAQLSKQHRSKSQQNKPQQQDNGSQSNAQQQQQSGPQDATGTQAATAPGGPRNPERARLKDQAMGEKLAEWGNLPPRLRDQLLQGMEDRFSSLYRDMTEKYYRRLAEQQR